MSPTHSPEQSGAGLSAGAHADLLKLPAVGHGGDHLGQLLLLALQDPVDVLGGHLLVENRAFRWEGLHSPSDLLNVGRNRGQK